MSKVTMTQCAEGNIIARYSYTKQPAEYPMIEGEGAPQYTFALDTAAEPVQLALL